MNQAKDELGKRGEGLAVSYLKRQGYRIVERNWQGRSGEIDIVALDGETIVFVEVKTRSTESFGSPKEAVTKRKRAHMTRVAKEYLKKKKKLDGSARFDVVAVSIKGATLFDRLRSPGIEHVRNAFDVSY